jgi:hypothetical protein
LSNPCSYTLATLLRRHGADFAVRHEATLTTEQRRALRDLAACGTRALGGHVWQCDHCGLGYYRYHACRNRHCPACQGSRRAAWLERESSWLLPVEYHHVVFTLPAAVAELAWLNRRVLYNLLFEAAQATLREVSANPRHLGALPGILLVLHTWGQNLHHHPHVHVVVTGGGLACDARGRVTSPPQWRSCRAGFFAPVRVLSRVFRGKYLAGLRELHDAGRLCLPTAWSPQVLASWLEEQYRREWVVYAKPPFGGPEQVLKYLARYTHRVALSNERLVSLEDEAVSFTWKDYAHGGKQRVQTLSVNEFLGRFVQHVLPRGFVKVRHAGLLANRERQTRLSCCGWLLALRGVRALLASADAAAAEPDVCPVCGVGRLVLVGSWPRERFVGEELQWNSS